MRGILNGVTTLLFAAIFTGFASDAAAEWLIDRKVTRLFQFASGLEIRFDGQGANGCGGDDRAILMETAMDRDVKNFIKAQLMLAQATGKPVTIYGTCSNGALMVMQVCLKEPGTPATC